MPFFPSSSKSNQSIIPLNTIVPSTSDRFLIPLVSSTYETCPSDSPPHLRGAHASFSSSSPSPYYPLPIPPLPQPPFYDMGGGKKELGELEGALEGLSVRKEQGKEWRAQAGHNKPLPHLPSPAFNSSNFDSTPTALAPRQDPFSPRYRAGSSFTTVYHNLPSTSTSPPPPPRPASSSTQKGAADLVLRKRDNGERTVGSAQLRSSGIDVVRAQQLLGRSDARGGGGRDDGAHHRAPLSASSLTPSLHHPPPSPHQIQSSTYAPDYHTSNQQQPYHPPRIPSSSRPPPPHVPCPASYSPYAPPPLQHHPYTSPPSLPTQLLHSHPTSTKTYPRQPSSSSLPPPSIAPRVSASQHAPLRSSPFTPQTSSPFRDPSFRSNTPTRRIRTESTVSLLDGKIQCSGRATSGQRCKRTRKDPGASPKKGANLVELVGREDLNDEDDEKVWYCHDHQKAILAKNTGCFVGGGSSRWVEFEHWIPAELDSDTRIALMASMEKAVSARSAEERGFLYCFEYRGLSSPAYRTFKIGSAKNVASRLEQWGAQCPSHDPKLLGVCPGEEGSRLRGMRAEAEAGRGVRGREWFEKLVHKEIASLDPGTRQREECVDCKRFHKEIFRVPRLSSGREWEDVVRPVMEKWERFVRMVLEEGG